MSAARVRILLIGDIVGQPGREIIRKRLREVRQHFDLHGVIANAENATGGSGLSPQNFQELLEAGVDCVTLGDHIYRRKEIIPVLEESPLIVKPANFPPSAPGREWALFTAANGARVAVISLLGRVFMRPVDCPLLAADRVLEQLPPDVQAVVVDYHAEATSDMQVMGRYLDGRVSAVLGTHTHVPTADEEIFPGGTAFQCDVGMTGAHLSILGRRIDRVLETTLTFRPTAFDVAAGDVRINGTLVEIDTTSRQAVAIQRLCVRQGDVLADSSPKITQ